MRPPRTEGVRRCKMDLEIGYREVLLIDPWAASRVRRLILLIGNREYDARVLIVERGGPEGEGFWLLEYHSKFWRAYLVLSELGIVSSRQARCFWPEVPPEGKLNSERDLNHAGDTRPHRPHAGGETSRRSSRLAGLMSFLCVLLRCSGFGVGRLLTLSLHSLPERGRGHPP